MGNYRRIPKRRVRYGTMGDVRRQSAGRLRTELEASGLSEDEALSLTLRWVEVGSAGLTVEQNDIINAAFRRMLLA